jgi:hypothetical protein
MSFSPESGPPLHALTLALPHSKSKFKNTQLACLLSLICLLIPGVCPAFTLAYSGNDDPGAGSIAQNNSKAQPFSESTITIR